MDAKAYHRQQLMRIAEHANNTSKSHLGVYLGEAADHIDDLHARLKATKTLRDEFAMAALSGAIGTWVLTPEDAACAAYAFADAMLEARNANR